VAHGVYAGVNTGEQIKIRFVGMMDGCGWRLVRLCRWPQCPLLFSLLSSTPCQTASQSEASTAQVTNQPYMTSLQLPSPPPAAAAAAAACQSATLRMMTSSALMTSQRQTRIYLASVSAPRTCRCSNTTHTDITAATDMSFRSEAQCPSRNELLGVGFGHMGECHNYSNDIRI